MNTPDRSLTQTAAFSIAELEARFEVEAPPLAPATLAVTSWPYRCPFDF